MSIHKLKIIANQIAEIDPILALDLEKCIRGLSSDKPGAFVDNLFKKKKDESVALIPKVSPPVPAKPVPTKPVPAKPVEPVENSMDKKPVSQAIAPLSSELKTLKLVKDIIDAAGPLVVNRRATESSKKILPILVRTAHTIPKARSVLMPVIRRIVEASK